MGATYSSSFVCDNDRTCLKGEGYAGVYVKFMATLMPFSQVYRPHVPKHIELLIVTFLHPLSDAHHQPTPVAFRKPKTARSDNTTLQSFKAFDYKKGLGPGLYDIHSPVVPPVATLQEKLEGAHSRNYAIRLWIGTPVRKLYILGRCRSASSVLLQHFRTTLQPLAHSRFVCHHLFACGKLLI